ncbi:hypothetical protein ACFOQM_04020 [Paenibacillus sp. GCM10012307]|uniref:hypothetical protein n=1 Tax=Paenibacillus sp. GCM10012307 TaxID=3317343 RepID=UPI00361227A4
MIPLSEQADADAAGQHISHSQPPGRLLMSVPSTASGQEHSQHLQGRDLYPFLQLQGHFPSLQSPDRFLCGQGHSILDQGHSIPDQGRSIPDQGRSIPDQGRSILDQGRSIPGLKSTLAL